MTSPGRTASKQQSQGLTPEPRLQALSPIFCGHSVRLEMGKPHTSNASLKLCLNGRQGATLCLLSREKWQDENKSEEKSSSFM